jgi:hypothetical protein
VSFFRRFEITKLIMLATGASPDAYLLVGGCCGTSSRRCSANRLGPIA